MDANKQINSDSKIDHSGKELSELKYFPLKNVGFDANSGSDATKEDRDVFVEVSRTFTNK